MEVCRRSSWLLTLLGVILLAQALQGVQGEVETEGPSESECRPYIEKALRELEHDHVGGGDADVGQSNEEASSIDNSSIDEKQSDEQRSQETAEIDIETQESTEKEAESDSQPQDTEDADVKTDGSNESETEVDDEAAKATEIVEQSVEVRTDEAENQSQGSEEAENPSQENETTSSTETTMSVEELETPPAEESEETTEDSPSAEDTQAEPTSQGTSDESQTDNEGETEQQDSTEETKTSAEAPLEEAEPADDQMKEETGDERSAEEEPSSEKAPETTESLEKTESSEKEEEAQSDEARTTSENLDTSIESENEKSGEVADEKEDENQTEEDRANATSEVEEEKSKESVEQAADQTSEEILETRREKRDVNDSNETPSQEKTQEVNEESEDAEKSSSEQNEEPEDTKKSSSEQNLDEDSKEKSDEQKEGDVQKSVESNEENVNDPIEVAQSVEENSKQEEENAAKDTAESKESNEPDSPEKSEVQSGENTEEGASAEKGSSEDAPEEESINGMEIPENLRPRSHVEQLLKLDTEATKSEEIIDRVSEITSRESKRLYDSAIKPLETLYKYRDLSNRHYGDAEIFSKPLILFMGPWSGGKSSIINYLLNVEYNDTALRTGAEPSPAYFNLLMYGEEEEVSDGTQLAADYTFSGSQKFGQGLEERLRGLKSKSKLSEKVNIVEIPGILEVRKQISRVFPFNDACQWFIDRADIIFLVYDPFKSDVGPETEAILDQLKGREYQTRIVLNKADQVKPEESMRVQGALIWNISPLMSSAQPPVMYTTSLWSRPYEQWAPVRLSQAQERAFLRDLRSAVDKRIENKIASARRFAVRVRNHAKMVDCYLTTYYNHKSIFGNKKQVSDAIIEHPQDYHIYEGLSTLTNISRYDSPDPEVYRDFFKSNPSYEFQQLAATCTYFRGCPINKLDVAIAYDLPELVGKHKRSVEAALVESSKQEQPQGS